MAILKGIHQTYHGVRCSKWRTSRNRQGGASVVVCMPGMPTDTVLTLVEVAGLLDVGLGTVRGWIDRGQLVAEERDGHIVVPCAEFLVLQQDLAEAHFEWAEAKLGDHIAPYGTADTWDAFSYETARAQWITEGFSLIGRWLRRRRRT